MKPKCNKICYNFLIFFKYTVINSERTFWTLITPFLHWIWTYCNQAVSQYKTNISFDQSGHTSCLSNHLDPKVSLAFNISAPIGSILYKHKTINCPTHSTANNFTGYYCGFGHLLIFIPGRITMVLANSIIKLYKHMEVNWVKIILFPLSLLRKTREM